MLGRGVRAGVRTPPLLVEHAGEGSVAIPNGPKLELANVVE